MANTTLTVDVILKEAHRIFKNNTPFLQGMSRQYDGTNEAYGVKAGDSIRIRQPMKYTVRTGKTISVQDNTENSVTLAKTVQKGVDLKFSSAELTQDISRFSELYIQPAINVLASDIENDIMTQAINATYNQVGTEGTDPATLKVILDAGAKMTNFSTPPGMATRSIVFNPASMASEVDALKGLFQDSTKIRSQYMTGQMGTGLGFEWAETANVPAHTSGTSNGAYLINGASQTGSTITVDTGSGTHTVGDIITLTGVNAVNPVTKADFGQLQQFTITAVAASGATSLSISPEIITSGAYQTVTASPADNAAVNNATGFTGGASNSINLAYHKLAYAFGTTDLEMPDSLNTRATAREVVDGISMRLVNFYDGINDDTLWRLDILYGFVAVTPEWACRIAAN